MRARGARRNRREARRMIAGEGGLTAAVFLPRPWSVMELLSPDEFECRGAPDGESLEALSRRARAGSASAFARIVSRLGPGLHAFLLRRVGDPHDAEDLTQEALLRAWREIGRYDERWAFSTWLFTIGSRLAVSHLRARARARGKEAGLAAVAEAGLTAAPGSAESDREQCGRLWSLAQRRLSEEQRAALWLRCAEDKSIGEIAHILGRSAVGVRVMLFRARATLAALAGGEETSGAGELAGAVGDSVKDCQARGVPC